MEKKRVIIISILSIIMIILLLVMISLIRNNEISFKKCESTECFVNAQKRCIPAEYIFDKNGVTVRYRIIGKEEGFCKIQVKVIQVKKGNIEKLKLVDKEMVCSAPMGSTDPPESKLERCSGRLKEEMQSIIIKKLYDLLLTEFSEENLNNITKVF